MIRYSCLPVSRVVFIFAAVMSASVATAQQVSIERQMGCAAEFAAMHTMLTTERAAGRDILFAQVNEMSQFMETTGHNIGYQLAEMDDAVRERHLAQFSAVLDARGRDLIVQASAEGTAAALGTAETRTGECLAELGSLASEPLSVSK